MTIKIRLRGSYVIMLSPVTVFIFTLLVGSVHCINHIHKLAQPKLVRREQAATPYLQTELSSCTSAQHGILKFLESQGVEIGSESDKSSKQTEMRDDERITVSTPNNNVECRISLGRAPAGSKCVAPCGCTGSQKWVQFSELNRLRRKDPSQWITCRTCQHKFEFDIFTNYGGLKANMIGFLLDNRVIVRSIFAVLFIALLYAANFPLLVSRAMTGHFLWQQVRTSQISHSISSRTP